jgi:hypothetical protein
MSLSMLLLAAINGIWRHAAADWIFHSFHWQSVGLKKIKGTARVRLLSLSGRINGWPNDVIRIGSVRHLIPSAALLLTAARSAG